MKQIFKYRCSNGDGTYSEGTIKVKKASQVRDYLVKTFHSISWIERINLNETVK